MKEFVVIIVTFLAIIAMALAYQIRIDTLKETNKGLVNENVSLKIENVNLNKIINKADAELGDTTIVLYMAKFRIISANFSN